MAADSDQTAEQIMEEYEGYRYSGTADVDTTAAGATPGVDAVVLVGLATPDGYTTLRLTFMCLSDGDWLVVHVGQGYSESPGSS